MKHSKTCRLFAAIYLLLFVGKLLAFHPTHGSRTSARVALTRTGHRPFISPTTSPRTSAIHELSGGSIRTRESTRKWQPTKDYFRWKSIQSEAALHTPWLPLSPSSSRVVGSNAAAISLPVRRTIVPGLPTISSSVKTPSVPVPRKEEGSLCRVDLSIGLAYFCNAFALTLPIILTPMVAAGYNLNPSGMTVFCGRVASIGIMGGGIGKIVNGLVCQKLGGLTTASSYLLGLGLCSLALSLSTSLGSVQWLVAGMEFFSSALWVSCSVILANHHGKDALSFARAVTFMSLSSTGAQLLAKTGGAAMLRVMNWRQVAQIGAILSLFGSIVIRGLVAKDVEKRQRQLGLSSHKQSSSTNLLTVLQQAKSVVSSKLFWTIGLAHVSGFLARTADRMLGPFLRDVTGLSYQLCGGLTASVTFGFAHGVMNAQKFFKLESVEEKNKLLTRWYAKAVAALAGLALVGTTAARAVLSPHTTAAFVALCSGVFASSVAFQFYQIPGMVATQAFSENKAICLAFLEGVAFFLTAPLWAYSSQVVDTMGWSASWTFVTAAFGIGAALMMRVLQPILDQQQEGKVQ